MNAGVTHLHCPRADTANFLVRRYGQSCNGASSFVRWEVQTAPDQTAKHVGVGVIDSLPFVGRRPWRRNGRSRFTFEYFCKPIDHALCELFLSDRVKKSS